MNDNKSMEDEIHFTFYCDNNKNLNKQCVKQYQDRKKLNDLETYLQNQGQYMT